LALPLALSLCAAVVVAPGGARGGGVLIPASVADAPDATRLALRRLDVRVVIDGPIAEVTFEQIYANKTDEVVEARYELPLLQGARVKAFSIWEGPERLNGVVVEKKRGRRLFEDLVSRALDPGLAETGDDHDENVFRVRVAPVPARGTSRVRFVYDQELSFTSLGTQLVVPLAARGFAPQPAGEVNVTVDVKSPWPIADASLAPQTWFGRPQLAADERGLSARFSGRNLVLDRDVSVALGLKPPPKTMALSMWAVRDPSPRRDRSPLGGQEAPLRDPLGTFAVQVVRGPAPPAKGRGRDVVFVLDTSSSMQGDKLDAAWGALVAGLGDRLGADDRFGVVLMNDRVTRQGETLGPASAKAKAEALAWVRGSYLAGGTDLAGGISAAAELLAHAKKPAAERIIIVITDGQPTWGTVDEKALRQAVQKALSQLPGTRLSIAGIGDDSAERRLSALAAASGGTYQGLGTWRGEGADHGRRAFYDRAFGQALDQVHLDLPAGAEVTDLYGPMLLWPGGDGLWFGRYRTPVSGLVAVSARAETGRERAELAVSLPERATADGWVARGWAKRRIGDLLGRIDLDGERREWIDEIIDLGRRFALVTPYTSFIAAPRALLRPRNFQAGDPILRVSTGPEIVAVAALFPWGETIALERVPDENVWETRFLAPAWLPDGTGTCTLVLTSQDGQKSTEQKPFTIDSTPPTVDARLDRPVARPGARLGITVYTDRDVRRISARLGAGAEIEIRWDAREKASIGELELPAGIPAGDYLVHVVAEDFAKNTTLATLSLTVLADANTDADADADTGANADADADTGANAGGGAASPSPGAR
jgi:Ca-activated chloride channel family protein